MEEIKRNNTHKDDTINETDTTKIKITIYEDVGDKETIKEEMIIRTNKDIIYIEECINKMCLGLLK